jgi:hypothetical protein
MTLFMTMVMMVAMSVSVVIVVRAAFRRLDQPSLQVGGRQDFYRRVRLPGQHLDTVLGKNGQRAMANAAGDDHLNVLFAQPSRECTGLVLGRRQSLRSENGLGVLVHVDQRKVPAAAEM